MLWEKVQENHTPENKSCETDPKKNENYKNSY